MKGIVFAPRLHSKTHKFCLFPANLATPGNITRNNVSATMFPSLTRPILDKLIRKKNNNLVFVCFFFVQIKRKIQMCQPNQCTSLIQCEDLLMAEDPMCAFSEAILNYHEHYRDIHTSEWCWFHPKVHILNHTWQVTWSLKVRLMRNWQALNMTTCNCKCGRRMADGSGKGGWYRI